MSSSHSHPRQRYKKPPIQEVVCQVSLAFDAELQDEDFERVYELWREDYPNKAMVADKHAHLHLGVEGVQFNETQSSPRMVCRSIDGMRIAQLSSTFLAVNNLGDYPGWENGFKSVIVGRLKEVIEVLSVSAITGLELRYIDMIRIPQNPINWPDWFSLYSSPCAAFGSEGGDMRLIYKKAIEVDLHVALEFGTVAPNDPDDRVHIVHNLNVASTRVILIDDIDSELERVHSPHSDAFEAILTDRTRALFEPEQTS